MTLTVWEVLLLVAGILAVYELIGTRARSATAWAALLIVVYLIVTS